ncbi:hypothetical protein BC940DRAFT_312397 [Gongronella butleri]|nr:hypothetical protein BC940DRAFT_312397 [Gongronella butleri]
MEDISKLRVVDLRERLTELGLSKAGKKDELVARLQEALESSQPDAAAAPAEEPAAPVEDDTTQQTETTTQEESMDATPQKEPSPPKKQDAVAETKEDKPAPAPAPVKEKPKEEEKPAAGKKRSLEEANGSEEKRVKEDVIEDNAAPKAVSTSTEEQPAFCVKGLVRPLILKRFRDQLEEHGAIKRFWIDNFKTHCYVVYESLECAKKAMAAMDGQSSPGNSAAKLSVVGLTESQADQLIDTEQKIAEIRGSSNWEKMLENVLAGIPLVDEKTSPPPATKRRIGGIDQITRQLQTRGTLVSDSMEEAPKRPEPAAASADRERASIFDRLSKKEPAMSRPASGQSLEELFLKTKTQPALYYKPVEEKIANERLEALKQK